MFYSPKRRHSYTADLSPMAFGKQYFLKNGTVWVINRIHLDTKKIYIVKKLNSFDSWLHGLKDRSVKIRLLRRLDKVKQGLLGEVKPVGEGVYEMREFFGPGWRMYYIHQGNSIILMLGGGDKST